MSDGTVMIIYLIVELIEKILLYKTSYFPPHGDSKSKIKIDLDLSTMQQN